jgi:hypothetical protein
MKWEWTIACDCEQIVPRETNAAVTAAGGLKQAWIIHDPFEVPANPQRLLGH